MLRLLAIARPVTGTGPELVVDIDQDLRLVRPLDQERRVLGAPIFVHSFLAMAGYPGYEPLEPFAVRDASGFQIDDWPEPHATSLREKMRLTRRGYLAGLNPKDRPELESLWNRQTSRRMFHNVLRFHQRC